MIELYLFATPNCWRASIALEELGLPYAVKWVNIRAGENRAPAYLARNPVGRVPMIEDGDGAAGAPVRVFGSAAILIHLAEKAGRLLPTPGPERAETLTWLMFAVGDLGVAFDNLRRFKVLLPEKDAYAIAQFEGDVARFCKVADDRLTRRQYLAGEHSIADIAAFPFIGGPRRDDSLLADYPNLKRWADALEGRPAVKRGLRTAP